MAARKKRVPAISLTQFVAIVTVTLVLTLLFGFAYKMNSYARIRLEADHLQERFERVHAEHEALKARKIFVQSNEYVEKVAREEFKWSRYGDRLVSVETLPAPTPFPTALFQSVPASEPTVPQWNVWWKAFFGDTLLSYGS